MVNSTKVDSIKDMLESCGISVTGIVHGYQRDGKEDEAMKKEAVDLARRSDVVLFFFGLNEKSEKVLTVSTFAFLRTRLT